MPVRQQQAPRFFHEHGYGPARLAAALARLDWSRADNLDRARALLADFVGTALAVLQEVARQRRLSPAALAGQLSERNDPDELPLLWLVTRHAAAAGQPLKLSPARQARLDAAAGPLRAHAQLLTTGELPASRLHELTPVGIDTVLALQLQQAAPTLNRPATIARLLKTAAAGEDKPRALTKRLRQLHAQLRAATPNPAQLDYATFRTLSHTLRAALLFTPGFAAAFLDERAQTAARPPSPDFDPLYFDRALTDLAAGKLDHLDVDTLVLGADASPVFRARIVQSLANGVGSLDCNDAVRERLIAASDVPEICLVACAVSRTRDDMRRALAHVQHLPADGVLGEALRRFSAIAQNGNPPGNPA